MHGPRHSGGRFEGRVGARADRAGVPAPRRRRHGVRDPVGIRRDGRRAHRHGARRARRRRGPRACGRARRRPDRRADRGRRMRPRVRAPLALLRCVGARGGPRCRGGQRAPHRRAAHPSHSRRRDRCHSRGAPRPVPCRDRRLRLRARRRVGARARIRRRVDDRRAERRRHPRVRPRRTARRDPRGRLHRLAQELAWRRHRDRRDRGPRGRAPDDHRRWARARAPGGRRRRARCRRALARGDPARGGAGGAGRHARRCRAVPGDRRCVLLPAQGLRIPRRGTRGRRVRDGSDSELIAHDDTGILVPAGGVDALRGALTTLRDDRGLARRLGSAGRARAVSQHDWDRTLDRILPGGFR